MLVKPKAFSKNLIEKRMMPISNEVFAKRMMAKVYVLSEEILVEFATPPRNETYLSIPFPFLMKKN